MPTRQHAPLVLVGEDGSTRTLYSVGRASMRAAGGFDESWLQGLAFRHPEALPLQEIEPSFGPLVPICTELDTRAAGIADVLHINPLGMPTLIECKLWRNPEARREVVGQILDYARALRAWSYGDLQREVARARKQPGFDLYGHVRDSGYPDLDESAFVDNVGRNLRLGRILLLILGDGIREGVEAIAEYLQDTTMQFTLGLVEVEVYDLDVGRRVVQPRILAKTMIVNRVVIETRSTDVVVEAETEDEKRAAEAAEFSPQETWNFAFWSELLTTLQLDDPNQSFAKPLRQSNIFFPFQPKSSMWLTCFFSEKERTIGVSLGSTRTVAAAVEIGRRLEAEHEEIERAFGYPVSWSRESSGKVSIALRKSYRDLHSDSVRAEQLNWFRKTINDFVNVLRPRIGAHLEAVLAGR